MDPDLYIVRPIVQVLILRGIKMMMMNYFLRRKLHTIISRELVKPSSPTSSIHHTYNLSELDQLLHHKYMPLILLYPHDNASCGLNAREKATVLKQSLSRTLTQYYPFSGRFPTPTKPSYVDCNGNGVVFVEAENDSKLMTYQHQHISKEDKTINQLFADNLVGHNSPQSKNVIGVQLNHFACGGVALAISMSHAIGDGTTLGSFINHWASVAQYGGSGSTPIKPHFIHSPRTTSVMPDNPQITVHDRSNNWEMRKFIFPNSKLGELKNMVIRLASAGCDQPINNPTRIEVLTSLLYKTAVAAASKKCGHFQPSILLIPTDIRKKFVEKLPQTTVGNLLSAIMVPSESPSKIGLNFLVSEIKKEKLQHEGVESVQHAAENLKLLYSKLGKETKVSYGCSSVCGFPFWKLDFGFGKPTCVTFPLLNSVETPFFLLMDTPNEDGIEAIVILDHEEMEIFKNDKEMLLYCQVN